MEDIIKSVVHEIRVTQSASNEKTGNIIVSTGRGGTGKSTFVALAAKYLCSPLLLLDIDPDQNLADMVGINLDELKIKTEVGREVQIKTVSDLRSDIEEEEILVELGGGTVFTKVPLLMKWYSQYTSEKFDLISLGPRWTKGDYRSANFLFEFVIPSMGKDYAHVVVDSPAGLEHLNRKVISKIDDLFIILDPSLKSLKHVKRVKKIIENVDITYNNLYLVGNHEFDEKAVQHFESTGETYLGTMSYDANVKHYNMSGKSLLDLPDSSPACLSMKRILIKAGYLESN